MQNNCRTCGEDILISDAVHLFKPRCSVYVKQIELITGLELPNLPHLPVYICIICTKRLLQAMSFRKQCINTEGKYQEHAALYLDHKDPLSVEVLNYSPSAKVEPKEEDEMREDFTKNAASFDDGLSERSFQQDVDDAKSFASKSMVNNDEGDGNSCENNFFLQEQQLHFEESIKNSQKIEMSIVEINAKTSSNCRPKDNSQKKRKPSEEVTVCEQCGKSVQKRNLEIHLLRHSGIKNFQCELCKLRFYTEYYLRLHIRKRHCSITDEAELELLHQLEHKLLGKSTTKIRTTKPAAVHKANEQVISYTDKSGRRNPQLSCDECGKIYKVRRDLELHILRHKGIKNYECEQCKARFYSAHLLKLHAVRHTEPFKCRYCDETFGYNYSRKRHERLHTNERPFECQYCDKRFMCSTSLKDHEVKHTGALNYHCKICELRFAMNKTLHAHLRSKAHKEIVLNQLKAPKVIGEA